MDWLLRWQLFLSIMFQHCVKQVFSAMLQVNAVLFYISSAVFLIMCGLVCGTINALFIDLYYTAQQFSLHNYSYQVLCNFSDSDLSHIHANCHTAVKMALTLLDYLFDRDTQAISNLSGTGKHSKQQLDPLMIYGIQCWCHFCYHYFLVTYLF